MPPTIEYIESVLANCRAATEANLRTAGREGSVVKISSEMADDVMITADLHGHRRNFVLLQRTANLPVNTRRHLIMQEVCHGGPTYPNNGGCMSHLLLEDVIRLKARFADRFHFILSNHEWAECVDYPILKSRKMLNLMFRLGIEEAYGPAADRVRQGYLEFLRSCPVAVRLPGDILVCHSAAERADEQPIDPSFMHRPLEPSDWQERSSMFRMLWGRDYRPENARAFAKQVQAKVLIHGHEPCADGFSAPNDVQLILDCCGDRACYLILPANQAWTHAEILSRVQKLK